MKNLDQFPKENPTNYFRVALNDLDGSVQLLQIYEVYHSNPRTPKEMKIQLEERLVGKWNKYDIPNEVKILSLIISIISKFPNFPVKRSI
jgi:hypothetical protein